MVVQKWISACLAIGCALLTLPLFPTFVKAKQRLLLNVCKGHVKHFKKHFKEVPMDCLNSHSP